MTIAHRRISPIVTVIWFDNRFWLARDTSHLLPGEPTKASRIEFIPYFKDELFDPMNLYDSLLTRQTCVRFTVNGETLYDGPATLKKFQGRRQPHIPHYLITPTEETL